MKRKLTKIALLLLLVLLGCYLAAACLLFSTDNEDRVVSGISIKVMGSQKSSNLEKEVMNVLRESNLNPTGKSRLLANTAVMEQTLKKSPLIDHVECFLTPSDSLRLEIYQRTPIMRVLNAYQESFYLDNKGDIINRSLPEAQYLPVVTGYVNQNWAKEHLYELALYLQEDKFWSSQIEQIQVLPGGDVEITPRVGDHTIYLGSINGFQEKLRRVRAFYDRALSKIGWETYSRINVELPNQIICTKKKN